ncbi:diguanylate cyclase domain-containing protein [Clostridium felsineum]|uniref:diguanylate cyclase domain-containing protein n=1 Tax=Clostridium felsineum TaxID=36839 RepID=UPI00098C2D28|nr:diguanylate cyclase [Clostridium felsineum]URZ03070.1 hypothetical protein CLAUR_031160 [Clostridium felsineum]
MNILSMLSFTNFILFVRGALYSFGHIRKSKLALPFMLVFTSLAIWCFGDTFFYTAPTIANAIFWYKLAGIGWVTFPATALHFFLLLTKFINKSKQKKIIIAIYIIPIIFLTKNIFSSKLLLAVTIIKNPAGFGWTDIGSNDLWFWSYSAYLITFIVYGLLLVYKWGKLSPYFSEKRQAWTLLIVSSITLIIGVYTDILAPTIGIRLPPISNIIIVLLAVTGFVAIQRYNLFSDANTVTAETILNTIKDPVLVFDANYKIIKINKATTDLLGYTFKQIEHKELSYILANSDYDEFKKKLFLSNKPFKYQEATLLTSDCRLISTIYSTSVAKNKYNEFLGYIITFKDITDRKAIENQLRISNYKYKKLVFNLFKAANYDLLTGLPNRRVFFSKLSKLANSYKRHKQDFVVIYMDLNGFKQINDNYGHDIGDYILKTAANRLKDCIKKPEILSRLGGDEFVILIPNSPSKLIIDDKINMIRKNFEANIKVGEKSLNIGISIGYSTFAICNENINTLVKTADSKMYSDKLKNKNIRV